MKLWAILTVFNSIGGVWGPLPYDMEECRKRTPEYINAIHHAYDSGKVTKQTSGINADKTDWVIACHYSNDTPKLGDIFLHDSLSYPSQNPLSKYLEKMK